MIFGGKNARHDSIREVIGIFATESGGTQFAASQRLQTLINNRPDGEDADQPGNRAECDAAHQCDLSYAFIPVTMNSITEADVRAFQAMVRKSEGPVLAHCKTGTRSLSLHLIGEVLDGRMSVEEIVSFGHGHGFDTSAAAAWLNRFADRHPQVKGFFDKRTWSIQYVVSDPVTGMCAIVDPFLTLMKSRVQRRLSMPMQFLITSAITA